MALNHYELGYEFGKRHAACQPEDPVYVQRYLDDLETAADLNLSPMVLHALNHELEYVRGYLAGYRWRYPADTPPMYDQGRTL